MYVKIATRAFPAGDFKLKLLFMKAIHFNIDSYKEIFFEILCNVLCNCKLEIWYGFYILSKLFAIIIFFLVLLITTSNNLHNGYNFSHLREDI